MSTGQVWVWVMVIFRWLFLFSSVEATQRATAGIGLHVNAHKTEYMCNNQTGNISTLCGTSLKLVDNQTGDISTLDRTSLKLVKKFTYQWSSVSSTEKDIDTRLTKAWKAWMAIDRLSIIWKSNLTDKMKRSFFQAAVVSILLYGCTTWTLIKRLKKKLDGIYARMLRTILNKSWQQHPTKHQLYGQLPPTTKTIQVRRTRHARHCWRSRDELISDVLQWNPAYGRAKAARTYIQQLCEDTGCSLEDLLDTMNDREKWRERVKDIRASGVTWWWWPIWAISCREVLESRTLYVYIESNFLGFFSFLHSYIWYHVSLIQWFTKLFAQMRHKVVWMGHLMRLELIRVGLLVLLANHYTTETPLYSLYK